MSITHTSTVYFAFRDEGYYEDDPDYYYEGGLGGAYVKLTVPKLPEGSGDYKVTITLEKVARQIEYSSLDERSHVWEQLDHLNDICSVCKEIAYGDSSYGGVRYPSSNCPGE